MNDLLDEDDVPDQNIVQYVHDLTMKHGVSAEDKEDVVSSVHVYVRRLSRLPSCYNRDVKYFSMCSCIKGLDDDIINSLGERIGK